MGIKFCYVGNTVEATEATVISLTLAILLEIEEVGLDLFLPFT